MEVVVTYTKSWLQLLHVCVYVFTQCSMEYIGYYILLTQAALGTLTPFLTLTITHTITLAIIIYVYTCAVEPLDQQRAKLYCSL